MKNIRLVVMFLIITALLLPGCNTGEKETAASSDFTAMLDMVPYSLFEEYDIFYGNFGLSREIHGVKNINSFNDYSQAAEEDKKVFAEAWNDVPNIVPLGQIGSPTFFDISGFNLFASNRTILINNAPPRLTYIYSGAFDEDLIISKLTGLGYQKTEYGKYGYYGIRGDYEPGSDNLSTFVGLCQWNRVAVLDDIVITSPATEFVTAILDTIEKKIPSIMENEKCQALAKKLGNPLVASLTTAERIITTEEYTHNQSQGFSFAIPDSWGKLTGYDVAGLGYRADGDKRYFDIALFYPDKGSAETDSKEILNRMKSYSFTYLTSSKGLLTSFINPGTPALDAVSKGETLVFSNEVIKTERKLSLMTVGGSPLPIRDLLFLSLEPEKYTSGNADE